MRSVFKAPLLLFLFFSITIHSETQSPVALETVVVVGKVPGPDLWKVTSGDNTLWILGTLSPLPKRMDWNSNPVEEVIEQSEALLLLPKVTTDLGFFQKLSLATTVIGIGKNPDKKTLKEILPEELYQRWSSLKAKYLPRNRKVEKSRPIVASQKLYEKALKESGLDDNPKVSKKVRRLARKHDLEFITPEIKMQLVKPKAALKSFKKRDMDDLECFSKTIERLEVDIEEMKIRANAWAYGDIDIIAASHHPDNARACLNAVLESQIFRDMGMGDFRQQYRKTWVEAAHKMLLDHQTSFAMMPVSELLSEDSILKELAAKGVDIVAPKSLTKTALSQHTPLVYDEASDPH